MSYAEAPGAHRRRFRRRRGPGLSQRMRPGAVVAALLLASSGAQAAGLGDIVVMPEAGQSDEQARRDRYECHNWAVAQTGAIPAQGPGAEALTREQRAERVEKVLTGAAVGAAAGSVIRGARDYRDAGEGALGGAVLGAIAGAVIGKRQRDESEDDEVFTEYFRALDACMSGRGYSLALAEETG